MEWDKYDEFEDEFEDELEDEDEVAFRYEHRETIEIDDFDGSFDAPQYYQSATEMYVPDSFTVRVENEVDYSGEEPVIKRTVTVEQFE